MNDMDFTPDWTSAPGETILDILRERQIPFETFAEQMGMNLEEVHELLQGKTPLIECTAERLSAFFRSFSPFLDESRG